LLRFVLIKKQSRRSDLLSQVLGFLQIPLNSPIVNNKSKVPISYCEWLVFPYEPGLFCFGLCFGLLFAACGVPYKFSLFWPPVGRD